MFDANAIMFASKKAAGLSGDLRNAFQLCRSAAELVLAAIEAGERNLNDNLHVRTRDIQAASLEVMLSPYDFIINGATSLEAMVIVCMASLKKSTGREDGYFGIKEILTKVEAVSGALGDPMYLPPVTFDELSGILSRLNEVRLI